MFVSINDTRTQTHGKRIARSSSESADSSLRRGKKAGVAYYGVLLPVAHSHGSNCQGRVACFVWLAVPATIQNLSRQCQFFRINVSFAAPNVFQRTSVLHGASDTHS